MDLQSFKNLKYHLFGDLKRKNKKGSNLVVISYFWNDLLAYAGIDNWNLVKFQEESDVWKNSEI